MALCGAVSVCGNAQLFTCPSHCLACPVLSYPPPFLDFHLISRFRDFPDVWILSKLPGDVLRKLEGMIAHEVRQTLQVQHEEVVQSGTCQIDPVSLEKLRSGLIFMTCLAG